MLGEFQLKHKEFTDKIATLQPKWWSNQHKGRFNEIMFDQIIRGSDEHNSSH
jgi:hypothetical protein